MPYQVDFVLGGIQKERKFKVAQIDRLPSGCFPAQFFDLTINYD